MSRLRFAPGYGNAMRTIASSGLGAAPLKGYGRYGPDVSVTLFIGRKAGLNLGEWREGQKLTEAAVDAAIFRKRAAQVGKRGVGGNVTSTGGWYQGEPEKSARFAVFYAPNPKAPNVRAFVRNTNDVPCGEKRTSSSLVARSSVDDSP